MRARSVSTIADALFIFLVLYSNGCIYTNYQGYHPRQTALCRASSAGDLESVKGLLTETKVDVNFHFTDGSTPILCAARGGNPQVVAYLLEQGADPEGDNRRRAWKSPLQRAVEGLASAEDPSRWQRIIELLVAHGADPRIGPHGALREEPPFRLQKLYETVIVLNLANTDFDDSDPPRLEGFTKLKGVDITGTQVTQEGLAKLGRALPDCRFVSEPDNQQ